ncbi:PHOsphatase [Mactra antiquata]
MNSLVNIALLILSSITICKSQNYIENGYGNNQFSTKTSYFWTYPKQEPVTDSLSSAYLHGRSCAAVHVNILSRHGARYVSIDDMRAFSELKDKLAGKFTNQSFDFINTWVNNYPEKEAELITSLGEEEMSYIGNTFGQELLSFLRKAYGADGLNAFQFSATRKLRTKESAHWFYQGLMKNLNGQNFPSMTPDVRDDILRFYDHCTKYELQTSNITELLKFENGTEFQKMINDIKARLGTNVELTAADVKMMYRLCATELAIMNNSDWCTIQTDKEREILEYDNDIEDYITRLYGYSVTQKMTCPLFEDIFKGMDEAIKAYDQGTSYKKGVFQFGHSDTIVDFLGAMGLFKDAEPILSYNFANMNNRQFRASRVDPFSTHLAFILYNCDGTGIDSYAVKLRFNGQPLIIPACGSDICWYSDVRQAYGQYIYQCDWKNECTQTTDPSVVVG